MARSILTPQQKRFLQFFSSQPKLVKNFYFTGGTALSLFYLRHRVSQDPDFFSTKEFLPQDITPFIRKAKENLHYKNFDFQQTFNRNIYQLNFPNNQFLKLEFTYFPFPQIEPPKIIKGLRLDSLLDIAANKVFTIAQNPRGRDFFDLYYIMKKRNWPLDDLIKYARAKFDWQVDPIQLGSQLLRVKDIHDDPILTDRRDFGVMEEFILGEAKKLAKLTFTKNND